ncbi:hypothetical protein N0V82_005480 [Gnomoniopsis sp. IMI 355080]|nr:hypothetical protein N0V82_005480 [Gnomoniopsis sp. IMI 355080]
MTNSMDCRYGQFIFECWDPTVSAWQEVPGMENTCGFALFDDPPKRVKVGERSDYEFLTLNNLGDSAIVKQARVYKGSGGETFLSYVRDINVGDRFRVRYTGTTLDWWAWGTKAGDLKDVEVWLPCWEYGVIVDVPEGYEEVESAMLMERDNGGRPKLKVAEAVPVEFEIVQAVNVCGYADLISWGDKVT